MNWKIIWAIALGLLASTIRQLLYVAIGAAQQQVNGHPEIFGVQVNWLDNVEWMASTAQVFAFLILTFFSGKKTITSILKINELETELALVKDAKCNSGAA